MTKKVRDSQPLSASPKATDPAKKAARKNNRAYKKHLTESMRKDARTIKEMPAAKWKTTPAAKRGETKRQASGAIKKIVRKIRRRV